MTVHERITERKEGDVRTHTQSKREGRWRTEMREKQQLAWAFAVCQSGLETPRLLPSHTLSDALFLLHIHRLNYPQSETQERCVKVVFFVEMDFHHKSCELHFTEFQQ